ncbi:hypothetical protein [Hymenobacter algoricola]|uniref:Uncharacterized protein n=1 Tax=Hymenobacter algoricola TaxID=486267 RepID=A0ABP7N729_9BACT
MSSWRLCVRNKAAAGGGGAVLHFCFVHTYHALGISKEAIDIVVAMRRRRLDMQEALARQTARAAQPERYLHGSGPVLDSDGE